MLYDLYKGNELISCKLLLLATLLEGLSHKL